MLVTHKTELYIIRSQDFVEITTEQTESEMQNGYLLTDCSLYAIPVLNKEFKIASAGAYDKVEVLSEIKINSVPYYKISTENGIKAYVVKSFVAEKIISDSQVENFSYLSCKKTDVFDENGVVIGKTDGNKVMVYSYENGMYKIKYKDGFGYVAKSAIDKKQKDVRNALLIILCATSFCITALYFQIRHNRKYSLN